MSDVKFDEIPDRENGPIIRVEAEWWNILKRAGIRVDNILAGLTDEVQGDILDNQSDYTDLTGMLFDGSVIVYAVVRYSLYRFNGTDTERRESGTLEFEYLPEGATWRIADRRSSSDALNITDSIKITTTEAIGQVEYKSDQMGGDDDYRGSIRWKVIHATQTEVWE